MPDATATEPNTDTGRFQVNRSGSVSQALTVYYRLSGTARNGTDYALTTNEVTLAAGQSSATVTITPVDDTDFEGPETVTLELSPSLRYLYGATTSGTLTLQDNDKPTVSVFAFDEEASEVGREPGEFELRRTGSLHTNLVVRFTLSGSATNTIDYDTLPTTVTFLPDVAVTNLVLRPKTDGVCEGTDTAALTLTADAAYQIRSGFGAATIWVADADKPPVNVVASDADAREASLNPGSFRFTRNGSTDEALTVRFRVTGTALSTVDYQPIGQTVTIPAGTNAASVSVVPINDTNQEASETVVATLAGGADYRVGATNSATVYLDDNEATSYFTDLDPQVGVLSRFSPGVAGGTGVDVPGEFTFYRRGSARSEKRFSYRVKYQAGPGQWPDATYGTHYTLTANPPGGVNTATRELIFQTNVSFVTFQVHTGATMPGPTNGHGVQLSLVSGQDMLLNEAWFQFRGADKAIRMEVVQRVAVEGGQAASIRLRRPVVPAGDQSFVVNLLCYGQARPSDDAEGQPDHNRPTYWNVTFPANQSTLDLSITATADTRNEGWESFFVEVDRALFSAVPDDRPFNASRAQLFVRDASTTTPMPTVDTDEDLLSDSFETANGMDPYHLTDSNADPDRDGLSTLEEQDSGSRADVLDTDADGLDDHAETSQGSSPTNPANNTPLAAGAYVEARLVTGTCYNCHATQLAVGPVTHRNNRDHPGSTYERVFRLAKGTNYPVTITHTLLRSELDLADSTRNRGTYTARIEPVQANAAWFLTGSTGALGTDLALPLSGAPQTNIQMIVPRVELTWTNKGDNPTLEDNTDLASTNNALLPGGGKRIYVGATNATETSPRNTVLLKIKTTPVLTNQTIWLKALDVDDVTREDFDAGVIDPNARAGNDNFADYLATPQSGVFVANNQATLTTNLNAQGQVTVEFKVGMQPGNNYRIAVTPFPANNLSSLQAGDGSAQYFVSAYTDTIRGGFNGELSPVLTVWRKLYLEIDSMEAPPLTGPEANYVSRNVQYLKTNMPQAGLSIIGLEFSAT